MPLTAKDQKIIDSMEKSYKDPEKAKRVFFASAQAGKLGRDVKERHGAKAHKKADVPSGKGKGKK